MRAIFTRGLMSRQHQPMDEWTAALERLAACCPNRMRPSRYHPQIHPAHDCRKCSETLREVLLLAMREDTSPLPLLEAVIEHYERRTRAA